ncbi:MAG: PadR family transcriptional regulator [Candidatus Thorarchaeota archaeon]
MRVSKVEARHKILLALDRRPYHGYDLIQTLRKDFGNVRQATIYRWLRDMEGEGLITSDIEPGPHGPDRRVYRVGSRGEDYLRRSLKQSIETILHFYDDYRYSISGNMEKYLSGIPPMVEKGRILFMALPQMNERDCSFAEFLYERRGKQPIDVLGDTSLLDKCPIKYRPMKGEPDNIATRNDLFSEIWTLGIPGRADFPKAISEFKRVMTPKARLRMIAPFVYFQPPEKPTISEFVRTTSVHLFPELGIVEGQEVGKIIEAHFPYCGASEDFPALVMFWAFNEE